MNRVVASSVRGPSHVRAGEPCQDAWLAVVDKRASLAVVCDGMGSRSQSREGSRAATLAARDAWRLWRRSPVGTIEDFIRLVEAAWRLRLGRVEAKNASTTCLIYAEDGHGRAALVQLGDGLIARRLPDGEVEVHPTRSEGFGLTLALGTPHTLADWSFAFTEPVAPGDIFLLATDGVSEDLEPDRLGDLATWVVDDLGPLPRPGVALARELRNWPVPHHQDDKTLLVMWKP
ncbi:protein phosphatase 2C domain-containing protein [Bradymonadaceae bacterium TMQ3]|nr:protein phosphatase 2C domain-containing protein [Bradymonadaceae bacterium TMQ3]TXC74485.1 protein phosphatase 2C domain-containing protein [Bradymonadales bacterium TMQ1]